MSRAHWSVFTLPIQLPCAHEGRDTAIATLKAKGDKVGVHLLGCTPLLTGLASFHLQPS